MAFAEADSEYKTNRSIGARILKPYCAVPPHRLTQEEVKEAIGPVFGLDERRLKMILSVVENSQVHERRLALPLEEVIRQRPLAEVMADYRRLAIELGREAAIGALKESGVRADEISMVITVSCTGLMIPSLDAYLVNELGMRPGTRRLPVTELGCAAGAAALSMASDYLRAWPERHVLVVAVELPSLTFQPKDHSAAHLISCTLFGDGAAAVVVSGPDAPGCNGAGARVLATRSHLFEDSYDAMGFDLRDSGLHIVLSRNVPAMIRAEIGGLTREFLQSEGERLDGMSFFWLHPGGQKVLAHMEEELGLSAEQTRASWRVLSQYGNLSSATVLYVMREAIEASAPEPGQRGLMAAFGPGFSSELLLLEWA